MGDRRVIRGSRRGGARDARLRGGGASADPGLGPGDPPPPPGEARMAWWWRGSGIWRAATRTRSCTPTACWANMTRTASGEWRSVEPTKIRRSQKLIGAYYRNELARRLQALGMAVAPTHGGAGTGVRACGLRALVHRCLLGPAPGDPGIPGTKGAALHGGEYADGGAAHAPAQGGQGLSRTSCRNGARGRGHWVWSGRRRLSRRPGRSTR